MKMLSILLVLYNDEEHIHRLVNSIVSQTHSTIKVYAIENSKSGASLTLLKELLPEVITLPHQGNIGYAVGNNLLAKKAISDGANYLWVLNPDMEMEKSCAEYLYSELENNKELGIVSPIVFYGRQNQRSEDIQFYAQAADFGTAKVKELYRNMAYDKLPESIKVNIMHGGSFMIKKELYNQLDFFLNEENYMYGDERDLAYRVSKTSFKMMVTKRAKCWHYHDYSVINKTGFRLKYYYRNRNRYLFLYKSISYKQIFIQLFEEILYLPKTLYWSVIKRKDVRLCKFYILGLFDGIRGRKGRVNYKF